jgi:hypothetical protein
MLHLGKMRNFEGISDRDDKHTRAAAARTTFESGRQLCERAVEPAAKMRRQTPLDLL